MVKGGQQWLTVLLRLKMGCHFGITVWVIVFFFILFYQIHPKIERVLTQIFSAQSHTECFPESTSRKAPPPRQDRGRQCLDTTKRETKHSDCRAGSQRDKEKSALALLVVGFSCGMQFYRRICRTAAHRLAFHPGFSFTLVLHSSPTKSQGASAIASHEDNQGQQHETDNESQQRSQSGDQHFPRLAADRFHQGPPKNSGYEDL